MMQFYEYVCLRNMFVSKLIDSYRMLMNDM
jgi:hypothetical protein